MKTIAKMSHLILICSTLAVLIIGCDLIDFDTGSNQDLVFVKFYGGEGEQICADAVKYKEGYLLAGTRSNNGIKQAFLVMTDSAGNELWSDAYGENGGFQATSITLKSDLLAIGGYYSRNDALSPFVVLYDLVAQTVVTDREFNLPSGDSTLINSISFSDQGGLIVAGSTNRIDLLKTDFNAETDTRDFWISSLGADLSTNWESVFGFAGDESIKSLLVRNGMIRSVGISSVLTTAGLNPTNLVLVSLDLSGNVIQAMPEGTSATDQVGKVTPGFGEEYFLISNQIQGENSSGRLLELDGRFLPEEAVEIAVTGDAAERYLSVSLSSEPNVLWLTGSSAMQAESTDFLVKKLQLGNTEPEVLLDKRLGFLSSNFSVALMETDRGEPVLAGTHEFGPGNTLFSLIKLNEEGELEVK